MAKHSKPKALVIGSGIAGIASAIRLNVKGYDVHVYEANSYPGGKLASLQLGKYRFDAGPSLFTMPHLVDELFELAGKNPAEYFSYRKSPTACHYFFEDGTFLPFSSDKKQLLETVSETLAVDKSVLHSQFQKSAFIYEKTHEAFLEKSLHRFKTFFSKAVLKCFLAAPRLDIFTTMHKANQRRLKHPKLVQIFDRFATYNGSNPYQAPGILNIIPHLEHGIGTFFPDKGMVSIVESLTKLAIDLGIEIYTNSPVEEIILEGKNLKGIKVKGQLVEASLVFCNADVRVAYSKLLPKLSIPKRVRKQEPSSSAMIFYWGVKRQFSQLDLHNIFFSEDYRQEFDCIFKQGRVYEDPTVYIHVSSKMNPEDAPAGGENWFVMVNVPSDSGQDWAALRHQIRVSVLAKLSRMLGEPIEELIEQEDYLDPIRIESRTSSYAGALYGSSSNKRSAAFFRHPNFSRIAGLYFVGGSVHPGGGIPLCLLSAKISTAEVKQVRE